MSRRIYVYADWSGIDGPKEMGVLEVDMLRGEEVFSFEYSSDWLKFPLAARLDPDLQHFSGRQYLPNHKVNFGLFLDSSPDRWGRMLMGRREAARAKKQERKEIPLFETDYLLGVFDPHRMGGIRFKLDGDGSFSDDNSEMTTPPWASLRKLEQISLSLEGEEKIEDPDYLSWLNMLVVPGSSLGGARPKANVVDPAGQLWIAKFPSRNDDSDSGAWEMVTHTMATKAGIRTPEAVARKFSDRNHTFLTSRFDRNSNGDRFHFASAMTMLGYTDSSGHREGLSYLELAEFLVGQGANTNADLEELWRRIVFSIAVSNTDDHLRNHGFILNHSGWTLSPAYDINPIETGMGLSLNISETDNALSMQLALDVSEYFRLSTNRAKEIIRSVEEAVSGWRVLANEYGIPKQEQELKEGAFADKK
jgi:serine/threonine-protein kinase HipA